VARKTVLAAGLVVTAALTLSGCGRTGVAASVDGRTITVDRLQSAVASLRAADKQAFGSVTDSQVLQVFLYGSYAEHAASVAGKGISDDEVRQAVAAAAAQNNDKTSHPDRLNAAALEALRGNLAFSQLDATVKQDILKQLQSAHVTVSPRYGTFDRTNGSITAPSPNWLQKPSPTPSATASPSATG
jgi:imidazolonepropionase-like amidohydrolase